MALLSFIFGLLVGIVVALLGSIALVNLLLIRRAIRNEGGLQEIAGAVDEFQKTPILLNKEHLEVLFIGSCSVKQFCVLSCSFVLLSSF